MVLGFVQKFLPDFAATDVIWVRSMKSSRFAVLNVQCRDVPVATRVKSTFAALVKSSNKPAFIGDVSISFAHTLGTRVRISLMRAMSKRQKEKDPNATCSVSAFTARPLLRVGGKDQGTRFLSFVDAVAGFRHLLTQEDLDRALSLCSGQKGKLKSRFLVLSDDRTLPPYQGPKKRAGPPSHQAFAQGQAAPVLGLDHISVVHDLQQPPPQQPSGFRFIGQHYPTFTPAPGQRGLVLVQGQQQQMVPGVTPAPSQRGLVLVQSQQQQMVPGVIPVQQDINHPASHQYVYPGQVPHQVPDPANFASFPNQLVPMATAAQVVPPNVQPIPGVVPIGTQPSIGHLVPAIPAVSQVSSPRLLPTAATPQVGVPDPSNQIIVQADVHSASIRSTETPFIKVTRKRVRKPALPPSVKRLTPLRKVKVEQKKPKVSEALNKSENQEEFASCPSASEDDADITEVVLGNSF